MKKLYFSALAAACVLAVTSCSNDEVITSSTTSELEVQNFEDFLVSLDSLNLAYSSSTRAREVQQYLDEKPVEIGSEGFSIRNVGITSAADWAGRIAGHYGGQWAGGALGGFLTGGNPVGVVAGCWFGRQYGGVIGGTLASAIAREFVYGCQSASTTTPMGALNGVSTFLYNAEIMSKECDSLGYYHNLVMCTVLDDFEKYINNDRSVDVDQLYDDVVACLAGLLDIDASLYSDAQTKKYFIDQVKTFYDNSTEFEQGEITYEELLEKNEKVLLNNFNVDVTIARKSTRVAASVYYEIASLDEEQTQRYAIDLNKVIDRSALSDADRELVRSNSEILINSKLCWSANEVLSLEK